MWTNGKMDGYEYSVKHFEEGSIFGIDGGRISKLHIRKDFRTVVSYDRGWDVEPEEAEEWAVYRKLVELYN